MRFKFVIALLIALVLVMGISYSDSSAGSSSIRYRQEKLIDPYSRQKYFGLNYTKPLFGFGVKDAQSVKNKGNFGRKGIGGNRNIEYNSFISQGRNPARISQFDSSWKGSKNLDRVIDLRSPLVIDKDSQTTAGKGVARLVAQQYEQNARLPFSQLYINVQNAPPSNATEGIGAWLVDEDSGYILHLGNFFINFRGTGSFTYRVYQYLGNYDMLMLTRESLIPSSPFPSEPILVGDIKK